MTTIIEFILIVSRNLSSHQHFVYGIPLNFRAFKVKCYLNCSPIMILIVKRFLAFTNYNYNYHYRKMDCRCDTLNRSQHSCTLHYFLFFCFCVSPPNNKKVIIHFSKKCPKCDVA